MQRMKVNTNQTAIDTALGLSGSLTGLPKLLEQLPVGERIGFDNVPTLLDVSDIGQTWTPDLQGREIAVTLDIYNAQAINKSPYGTDLTGIAPAISWGESIIDSLFIRGTWTELTIETSNVSDELKHSVNTNQTAIDVAFDITGSLVNFPMLLEQLPATQRIGLDDMPYIWEDINDVGQTWTPDLQGKSYVFTLKVANSLAMQKAPFGTDINILNVVIEWGNNFLSGASIKGEYLTDDLYNFGVDDDNNFITT
jgi:hypothetical protein